jgi:hypothetical protein
MDYPGRDIASSSSENIPSSEPTVPIDQLFIELIGSLPQSEEGGEDARNFITWFNEIVNREYSEHTNLLYTGTLLKLGVILVGKDKTWEDHGVSAYMKWADYYATEQYNTLCILGRGAKGFSRSTEVKNALISLRGYEQLNLTSTFQCKASDGGVFFLTGYILKLYPEIIKTLAWAKLKDHYSQSANVHAVVERAFKEHLLVNVFSQVFVIQIESLSELAISDARSFFIPGQHLSLNILSIDAENKIAALSNKGTPTDPKQFIDDILAKEKIYDCVVETIRTDKNNAQAGLLVSTSEFRTWIFIPRSKAIRSKSALLSDYYPLYQHVDVKITCFNAAYSCFVGQIENLSEQCSKPADDHPDPKPEVKANSGGKKPKSLSLRLIPKGLTSETVDKYLNKTVEARILEIHPDKGISISLVGEPGKGYIIKNEIAWAPVKSLDLIYNPGDIIYPLVYGYNEFTSKIIFSLKRNRVHQFDEWVKSGAGETEVVGKVINYIEKNVHIELDVNGFTLQAYIIPGEISAISYLKAEDVKYYLPVGESFHFFIQRINEQNKTIALSRIKYLQSFEDPEFGETFSVWYTKTERKRSYFYADDIEGWIKKPVTPLSEGEKITVMPVSLTLGEFVIV